MKFFSFMVLFFFSVPAMAVLTGSWSGIIEGRSSDDGSVYLSCEPVEISTRVRDEKYYIITYNYDCGTFFNDSSSIYEIRDGQLISPFSEESVGTVSDSHFEIVYPGDPESSAYNFVRSIRKLEDGRIFYHYQLTAVHASTPTTYIMEGALDSFR